MTKTYFPNQTDEQRASLINVVDCYAMGSVFSERPEEYSYNQLIEMLGNDDDSLRDHESFMPCGTYEYYTLPSLVNELEGYWSSFYNAMETACFIVKGRP